jgi:cell division septation protein DedD
MLLVGLPVFAVFAAFGAIVWLAYERGADISPVGEPPLIKAPAMALKLPPDEAGAPAVADQGEVRDLLTDTAPSDQLEQLLPPPEEPLAPTVATPDATAGGAAAVPPPAPADTETDTAAADQAPSPQVTPPPAVTPPLPQVATTAPEPPRQAPLAVERQSAATAANPAATVPQPSPKEAEAALDALLAEVTKRTNSPPTAPAPTTVQPAPTAPVQPRPPAATAAANPALTPRPAQPAPPPVTSATANPFTRPGGEVTAIAPDRPSSRPSAGATTAPIAPATNGSVAALDGAYRIQLAAVRDEADARRAWDLFLVDLGSVLQGVQPFIERAETANGVFYRVQIGPFANLQDAESLCDELKRRNASCFVIRR